MKPIWNQSEVKEKGRALKHCHLDKKKATEMLYQQLLIEQTRSQILSQPKLLKQISKWNVTIEDENIVLVQMNKSNRTRAESQQIVTQGYSNMLTIPCSKLSRLQRISVSQDINLSWRYDIRPEGLFVIDDKGNFHFIPSSKASSLEAFSCYPTHGSFSALTCRSTEITGHVNQRFLSYCDGLLLEWILISRIKLTCLATV